MGNIVCTRRSKDQDDPASPRAPRSPRGALGRCSGGAPPPPPGSLLAAALGAACAALPGAPRAAVAALPPDLAQLLLDALAARGALDGAAVGALSCQSFFALDLAGADPGADGGAWPAWLAALSGPALERVSLARTAAPPAAVAQLAGLPRLRALELDGCALVTDAAVAALLPLPALEELSLAGCPCLGGGCAPALAALPRLRRLSLQGCPGVSVLAPLAARAATLEDLNLGWCAAVGDADAAAVGALAALTRLEMGHTGVGGRGLAALAGLTRLHTLGLGGLAAHDADLAALLARLPRLRTVSLARCALAGDAAVAALATGRGPADDDALCGGAASRHAPLVEELDLSYTLITPAGVAALAALTALRALSVEACAGASDAALGGALPALRELRSLDVSDTRAGAATAAAAGGLPCLASLDLSFTAVPDRALGLLGGPAGAAARGAPPLRRLALDSRQFTDLGVAAAAAALPGLECLSLFGAAVGDGGCAALARLKNLRRLEVCSGAVTDAGAAHLAALPALERLSLGQNARVTDAALPALAAGLARLTSLNLSHTSVTGAGAARALRGCTALRTLALGGLGARPRALEPLRAALPGLEILGVPGLA